MRTPSRPGGAEPLLSSVSSRGIVAAEMYVMKARQHRRGYRSNRFGTYARSLALFFVVFALQAMPFSLLSSVLGCAESPMEQAATGEASETFCAGTFVARPKGRSDATPRGGGPGVDCDGSRAPDGTVPSAGTVRASLFHPLRC